MDKPRRFIDRQWRETRLQLERVPCLLIDYSIYAVSLISKNKLWLHVPFQIESVLVHGALVRCVNAQVILARLE